MSSKQLKKLVIILLSAIIIVGLIFAGVFFLGGNSNLSNDIETIKANGNYEILKTDLVSLLKIKESQAATISNILFEDMGVKSYESIERGGIKGNLWVYVDGYKLDTFIRGGNLLNIYIGNILVYKNTKYYSSTNVNVMEYTYPQYNNLVDAFKKGVGVEKNTAQTLFENMTNMGINNLTDIKKGKLNGLEGFYGYEGTMKYFFTLSVDSFKEIYVVCAGFEPIKVYDLLNSDSVESLLNVKVTYGVRMGISTVMNYKVSQATGLTVTFPAALSNGDDSWLMVRYGDEVYIEVRGEVTEKEKVKTKDFIIKLQYGTNDLLYLKMDNKVYLGS